MWFSLSLSKDLSSHLRKSIIFMKYDVIFTFTLLTEIDWFESSKTNHIVAGPLSCKNCQIFNVDLKFQIREIWGNYAVINIIDIPDKQAAAKAQRNGQTKSCLRFSKINIIWSYCEQNSINFLIKDTFFMFRVLLHWKEYILKSSAVCGCIYRKTRGNLSMISKWLAELSSWLVKILFLLSAWFLVKKDRFEELHIFAAHGSNVPTCTRLANVLIYIKPNSNRSIV